MALDQSIFTSSKAIAKAIHDGDTPNGKWSEACFSPVNLEENAWCDIDTYARHRLAQYGLVESTKEERGTSIRLGDDLDFAECRQGTLRIIDELNVKHSLVGNVPIYQIGLFRGFRFLNVLIEDVLQTELKNDGMVGFNADLFKLIRLACQSLIGDGQVRSSDVKQFRSCIDFADLILSFPEAEGSLFYYNPWW